METVQHDPDDFGVLSEIVLYFAELDDPAAAAELGEVISASDETADSAR